MPLLLATLLAAARAGDSYVPPAPPPRVVTYTETWSVPQTWTTFTRGSIHQSTWSPEPEPEARPAPAPLPEIGAIRGCYDGDGAQCAEAALLGSVAVREEMFRRGCALDSLGSCEGLALVIAERSLAEAAPFARRACDGGLPVACGVLGTALFLVPELRDPEQARPLLQRGCEAGLAPACESHGHLLLQGTASVAADPQAARAVFARECDGGNPLGCAGEAWALEALGDRAAAVAKHRKVCWTYGLEPFPVMSCRAAGVALLHGDGVPRDRDEAVSVFEHGCAHGDGESCAWRAHVQLAEGDPVGALITNEDACRRQDAAACVRAVALSKETFGRTETDILRGACLWGSDPTSCAEGGRELAFGVLDVDLRAAVPLLDRACTARLPDACADREVVGAMLGEVGAAEAVARLEAGCERHRAACVALAERYEAGDGVPRSEVEAVRWRMAGCALDGIGCRALADARAAAGDAAAALHALELAAAHGDTDATALVGGYARRNEGRAWTAEAAWAAIEAGCRAGDRSLCTEENRWTVDLFRGTPVLLVRQGPGGAEGVRCVAETLLAPAFPVQPGRYGGLLDCGGELVVADGADLVPDTPLEAETVVRLLRARDAADPARSYADLDCLYVRGRPGAAGHEAVLACGGVGVVRVVDALVRVGGARPSLPPEESPRKKGERFEPLALAGVDTWPLDGWRCTSSTALYRGSEGGWEGRVSCRTPAGEEVEARRVFLASSRRR